MGWKSTITLTRRRAEDAVRRELDTAKLSDADLGLLLELIRGGEYHGHNYMIGNYDEEDEDGVQQRRY